MSHTYTKIIEQEADKPCELVCVQAQAQAQANLCGCVFACVCIGVYGPCDSTIRNIHFSL